MQAPFRHTVLFDEGCPICRGSVDRLRRWDTRGRLEFLPNQDPELLRRFPGLNMEALGNALHLVTPEGEILEGAEAVEGLVRLLPGLAWTGWLFHLPWARPLARRIYRWVARNRYRLRCREHCDPGSLPDG